MNILTDYTDEMESHESDFVEQLQERFDKYGDETFISGKQIGWLRSLEARYAG